MVTTSAIRDAVRSLGLSGRSLCIHSSLRSFGWVEGGSRTVVGTLLAEGCTVLVPAFTEFGVPPPPSRRLSRNGWDYDRPPMGENGSEKRYTPELDEIAEEDMGEIPAAVVRMPLRVRGNHPLCSFAAVGPLAHPLIVGQEPLNVFAPLAALAEADGLIVLMGVGLEAMTFLHLAEQGAGRNLFRRWAKDAAGNTIEVETGGCSHGFINLDALLAPLSRQTHVGQSLWRAFPARATLELASEAIRRNPTITHCGTSPCRCDDAVLGGPLLP